MSTQSSDAEVDKQPKRAGSAVLFRALGFLFCAVLTAVFGLVPFLLGLGAQFVSSRRLPGYVTGPLGIILFFVIWLGMGWLGFTINDGVPLWPSVVVSLVLFVAFFASGVRMMREWLPRCSKEGVRPVRE